MDPILGAIIVAIITGGLSLVGVIVTNTSSNKAVENRIMTAQAVTDTKIDALREEVRKHNNFASRIPILETEVAQLKKDVEKLQDDHK